MQAIVVTPQVAAGAYHSVALKSDGTVVAWGAGKTNAGTFEVGQSIIPRSLKNVIAIAAGDLHTVALKSDGTVVVWGAGQTTVPTALTGVTSIAAGGAHTVALKIDGTVVAWGDNFYGQTTVPTGLTGVIAVAAGGMHTIALKSDGTVVAWGSNFTGQATVPNGLTGVVAIAAGQYFSMALKSDGTIVAWGKVVGNGGVLHPIIYSPAASLIVGIPKITAISSGSNSQLIVLLTKKGTVITLGHIFDGTGYIGIQAPAGLKGVVEIAAGTSHIIALKSDGTIVAWGYNTYGQTTVPSGLLPSMMKTTTVPQSASTPLNIALKKISVSAEKPSNVTIQFRAFDSYSNAPITNLKQSQFKITQDGYALSAESFVEVKKATELKHQIDTILMIDISSSINSLNLQAMKKAAKAVFLDPYGNNKMLSDQRIAIYAFDDAVTLIQDFTSDPRVLNAAIDTIVGRGVATTNMYGAIVKGMARLKTTTTLTSLIEGQMMLITDGRDTAARSTLAQAQAVISKNRLYVVGVKSVDLTAAAVQNIKALTPYYTPINNFSAVKKALRDINMNIEALANSFYQVLYTTPARAGLHNLSLSVVNNHNTGVNAKVTGSFDAAGFTQAPPQVLIQGAAVASIGDTVLLKAVTRLVAVDSYAYTWVNQNQTLATLLPVDPYQTSIAHFKINQKGIVNIVLKDARYPNNSVKYQLIVDDMSISHAGVALSSIALSSGLSYALDARTLKPSLTAAYTWSIADPLIAKIDYTTGSLIHVIGLKTGQTNLTIVDKNNHKTLTIPVTVSLPMTKPVMDTLSPVMTLLGSSTISIVKGTPYNDAGATAMDNIDGNVTANIKVTNSVNNALIGTYTVLYDVQDAAFNAAKQMQRVVHVIAVGAAAQRGSAVQVPMSGNTPFVDIYAAGQVLSSFSSVAVKGTAPAGIKTPLGVLSYTTTVAAVGGTQTVVVSFATPLPASFSVYKIDNAGTYTLIPKGFASDHWNLINASSIVLRLKDGGIFDLDGLPNGVIVDPLAIATKATVQPTVTPSVTPTATKKNIPTAVTSSGGGCTLQPSNKIDPIIPILLFISVLFLLRRKTRA